MLDMAVDICSVFGRHMSNRSPGILRISPTFERPMVPGGASFWCGRGSLVRATLQTTGQGRWQRWEQSGHLRPKHARYSGADKCAEAAAAQAWCAACFAAVLRQSPFFTFWRFLVFLSGFCRKTPTTAAQPEASPQKGQKPDFL